MRFMMLMMPGPYEGLPVDTEHMAAMGRFNAELQKAGVLLAVDGLHPPATGARVSFKGGKPVVRDGPFAESKEVLGGYWLIQVNSREEAIEWARRIPGTDGETVEVRQVQEMGDFPEHVRKALRN